MYRFYDKTRNQWADRRYFEVVRGKYRIVEIDYDADSSDEEVYVCMYVEVYVCMYVCVFGV